MCLTGFKLVFHSGAVQRNQEMVSGATGGEFNLVRVATATNSQRYLSLRDVLPFYLYRI